MASQALTPVNERWHLSGSIVRVYLQNFMVYTKVEAYLGSRMNLILGPNGSGKSSLVCAIVLALGGSPKVLGRAKNTQGYIKHGCDQAIAEVELYNATGPNDVIRRVMTLNGASQFLVNHKESSASAVQARMRNFGIQVGNLCNVLPQEQMGRFTTFSSKQLLVETEKALDHELYEMHQDLIQLQESNNKNDAALATLQDAVTRLTTEHDRLQVAAKQLEKRDLLLWKADMIHKRYLWSLFESAREQATVMKAEKDTLKAQLKEAEAHMKPLRELAAEATTERKAAKGIESKALTKANNAQRAISKAKQQLERATAKRDDAQAALEALDTASEDFDKQLARARTALAREEAKLEALPDRDALDAERRRLKKERLEATAAKNKKMDELEEASNKMKSDLRQCTGVKNRAMRKVTELRSRDKQIARVLQQASRQSQRAIALRAQYKANPQMFSGKVFGPVPFELQIDPRFADTVETILPNWVLTNALFCEDPRDERKITSSKVGCFCVESRERVTAIDTRPLHALGIKHTLAELIDGPWQVVQEVCKKVSGHTTLIGDDTTDRIFMESRDAWQKVPPQCTVIYTATTCFRRTRSSYGSRQASYTQTPLQRSRGLLRSAASSPEELTAAEEMVQKADAQIQQLQQELGGLKSSLDPYNKRHREAVSQYQHAQKQYQAVGVAERAVKKYAAKIQSLQQQKQEAIEREREERQQAAVAVQASQLDVAEKLLSLSECQREWARLLDAVPRAFVYVQQLLHRAKVLALASETADSACNELRARFKQVKKEYAVVYKDVQKRHKLATEEADLAAIEPRRKKPYREVFAELQLNQISAEELNRMKDDVEGEAEGIEEDRDAIANFEEVKRKLTEASERLEGLNKLCTEKQRQISQKKEMWLKQLRDTTTMMQETFANYFEVIKCKGEMSLETAELFADYSIELRVSFRKGVPPKILSATTQSGGERAVSTMLFLLAMQENPVSNCPFRLVDEMNQGMDHFNERTVFQLIVEACAKRARSPQYIVLTPKLLSNLEYQRHCRVLVVYNGPFIQPSYAKTKQMWNYISTKRKLLQNRGEATGPFEEDEVPHSVRPQKKQRRRR